MRKIAFLSACILMGFNAGAQSKQGLVVFERIAKLQIQISDPAFANTMPHERKNKFELLYSDNKTLWRPTEEEQEPEMHMDNGAGAEIRIVTPGSTDITYTDLNAKRKVEQREIMTKNFIVEDSIRSLNWKISPDTKTLLGYPCRKATTTKIQPSIRVNVDNGVMKREQVTDTVEIIAWFTDAIPVFSGPDSYQGQLPGMILELDVNKGSTKYTALSIAPEGDFKNIKEPKGKKITPQEFAIEREKMFKEMEKNNGGGNVNIRVGG